MRYSAVEVPFSTAKSGEADQNSYVCLPYGVKRRAEGGRRASACIRYEDASSCAPSAAPLCVSVCWVSLLCQKKALKYCAERSEIIQQ